MFTSPNSSELPLKVMPHYLLSEAKCRRFVSSMRTCLALSLHFIVCESAKHRVLMRLRSNVFAYKNCNSLFSSVHVESLPVTEGPTPAPGWFV